MYSLGSQNKHLTPIVLLVIALHMVLVFWVIFIPSSPLISRKREHLVVKTVQLNKPMIQKPVSKTETVETPPPSVTPATIDFEPTPKLEPMPKSESPPKAVEELPKPVPTAEPIPKIETPKSELVKKTVSKVKPTPTQKKAPKKAEPIKKQENTKKTVVKKELPKPITKTADKKPAKAAPEKPKVDPKVEAAKAKAQQEMESKQKKLLAAAQESIAKMDQSRAKINSVKSNPGSIAVAPAAITSLQIDTLPLSNGTPLSPGEKNYRDELASRLKLMLKLPDHGDVQLKLTLDRTGKATKVSVVKSESSANRSYIEKTLPNLKFPSFGSHFENMSEYTFIIQLSNEL